MNTNVKIVLVIVALVLGGLFIRYQGQNASSTSLESDSGMQLSDIEIEQMQQNEGGDEIMANNKTNTGNSAKMAAPKMEIDENAQYTAVLKTTKGDITIELTAQETPVTVNNFVVLANKGFYDGTKFHRVIEEFMIQGGDPAGNGTGGPGYTFADEITPAEFDSAGILAMANRGPNTNGSQFFITLAPTPWLNGNHTIFGRVTEGMEVVEAIEGVEKSISPSGELSIPVEDIILETVEIQSTAQ